jgi:hypothetical protein
MSDLNLDNIVGFKAVDKDGNEQNVTVDEMVDMVATRMVTALSETSALSEISTLATAAATGNDVYENELPTVTDAANVRVLQSGGEAAQMTMQSLATKLGELLPDSLGFLRGYNNPASLDTNINGIYNTNESVQGTWPLYAHKYGVLVVLCSKSFGAAQIYISDGTENIYVRKSYNLGKTWEEWLLIKGVNIT